MTEPFTIDQSVVDAVANHMNSDHRDDNLVICQGVGGCPEATAATMTGLDADTIEFTADTPAGSRVVRVPFSTRISERSQIRHEVAQMFHESEALLDTPA